MSQIAPQSTDHQVRLLLPFFLDRDVLCEAKEALCNWSHVSRKSRKCWQEPEMIPKLYQEEALPNVGDFLFAKGSGCCAYFRVLDETRNFWFKNGGTFSKHTEFTQVAVEGRPTEFEVTITDIELFLSPHGAGIFSVIIAPKHCEDSRYLQELNYRLSQTRKSTTYPFHLPHNEKNKNPKPAPNAPLVERLGQAGGAFTLMEWVNFLLQPLESLNFRPMQQQFSVYSVTRFGIAADFTDSQIQANFRSYLAAVAHVEEYNHVGSLQVTAQVLNPRHFAAVGSLGVAHLVSDQNQPPRDFDEQRMAVSLYKYFVPYLLTLMQRIALQGILEQARNILVVSSTDTQNHAMCFNVRLRELNRHTLAFTVNGWFTETSSREVVNQYYTLAQRGLRVQDSFQTVQRALHDAEVMDNDCFQNDTLRNMGELAKQANRSVGIVAHVQSKVEWLEVFFVSYYATALAYYINHDGTLFNHYYTVASLIGAPIVSGLIAFFGLSPHKIHLHNDQGHSGEHSAKNSLGFLLALVLMFILWLMIGFCWFENPLPTEHSQPSTATLIVKSTVI